MKDLFYEVIVTDKHGKVIGREAGESRSWLVAYNKMLAGNFGETAQTIVDITGTGRGQDYGYQSFGAQGVAGDDNMGIVVGTGTTPVDIEDYAMVSQVAHGSGAGQLSYIAQVNTSPTVDATSSYFTLTRQFLNVSGGDITIGEIGLYGYIDAVPTAYYGCFVRDVLATPRLVPDGGAMTVVYTFKSVES